RGGDRDIDPHPLALDDDVSGQAPQSQPLAEHPRQPDGDEDQSDGDQQLGHRRYLTLAGDGRKNTGNGTAPDRSGRPRGLAQRRAPIFPDLSALIRGFLPISRLHPPGPRLAGGVSRIAISSGGRWIMWKGLRMLRWGTTIAVCVGSLSLAAAQAQQLDRREG